MKKTAPEVAPPPMRPWMKVAPEIMDERVLRVLTRLCVEAKLKDDVRCVWGCDVEAAYRRAFRQPSTLVREALKRLQQADKIEGPLNMKPPPNEPRARPEGALDLYSLKVGRP